MIEMQERYKFIDILKGISILLVVYGHITPGAIPIFTEYAGIFTMPLFFFVSGVLFNEVKYRNNFKEFLYRRYRGLVIPYFYFSIIVALCYIFIQDNYFTFITHLLKWGWGGYALWFIPVLLLSQILYFPICKLSVRWRLCVLSALAIGSFFSSRTMGYIPYNLGLCFCGAYFFGMGNVSKKYLFILKTCVSYKIPTVLSLGFIMSLCYLTSTKQPQWFINDIPSFVFYVAPFGSIACLTMIAIIIEKMSVSIVIRLFSTCGKQSYILLAFHQIICLLIPGIIPPKITISLMALILSFLVWFIPKYMPWMLGKMK